jgi:aminoglycoside/choline kinase family phosphotransferase
MSTPIAKPSTRGEERISAGREWAAEKLHSDSIELRPVSGDASFRRYFRTQHRGASYILMDAPPGQEDSTPFVDIANRLRGAGLHAPEIFAFDLGLGFGLLEDLGDRLYKGLLDRNSVDDLIPGLFDVLATMAKDVSDADLPAYDSSLLQQEMDLFTDWYLGRHRQRTLSKSERALWENMCDALKASAAAQPQVFVHKDFHSCNLLLTPSGTAGIIDFQDAVTGPVSYDFISLIWDRYIAWPRNRLLGWMSEMHAKLDIDDDLQSWVRCCDWMGLQRNLKIVGIFSRLHYRDGKEGYLEMIPRFYGYLLDVLPLYPEFSEFRSLLGQASCAP